MAQALERITLKSSHKASMRHLAYCVSTEPGPCQMFPELQPREAP